MLAKRYDDYINIKYDKHKFIISISVTNIALQKLFPTKKKRSKDPNNFIGSSKPLLSLNRLSKKIRINQVCDHWFAAEYIFLTMIFKLNI